MEQEEDLKVKYPELFGANLESRSGILLREIGL
jgi:hypothetical protein